MKWIIFLAIFISGCATHSGVLPEGKDSYVVIVSGGHSFASSGDLKIDAYIEAATYCKKAGLRLEVISEKITQKGVLDDFSEAYIKFRCVDAKEK
jgi:hypothetical protein